MPGCSLLHIKSVEFIRVLIFASADKPLLILLLLWNNM